MRTFYIFNIKREISILTKDNPYNLYRTIESFYYFDNLNSTISFKIYNDIFNSFDKEYIDKRINNLFKNNRYYTWNEDIHKIDNKYRPEHSKLKVYKSHILLKTDVVNSLFLKNYLMTDNLFVCDFQNKDYFWLNEFVR